MKKAADEGRQGDIFDYLVERALSRLERKAGRKWGDAAMSWYNNRFVGQWARLLLFNHGPCTDHLFRDQTCQQNSERSIHAT